MPEGLRERKRQDLRDRLSLTTVLLARERGLANVRVEDVVNRVGVSRRTFSNYFASKEEAIADRHVQRAKHAASALRTRPSSEPLWDAVTAAVLEPYSAWEGGARAQPEDEKDSLLSALADPDMQAAIARGSRAAVEEFAHAIARRMGADIDRDVLPRLVADAALSTALITLEFWLRSEPQAALLPLMRETFDQLGRGFGR